MAKKFERLLSAMLAVLMCFSILSIPAFAEGENSIFSEKISKTSTALDENDQVDVTLGVPGENVDLSSDIVFIIGNGPADNYNYLVETIRKMLIAVDGSATKIKLGLVGFADTTEAETVLPLTEMNDTVPGNKVADYRIEGRYNDGKQYTESAEDYKARKAAAYAAWEAENPELVTDMEYIIAKGLERAEEVYSGINLESSLITARDMLVADTSVPADRKHMIVVSTGLTYWFDNDQGEPVTIIGTNKFGTYMHGNKYWLQARDASTNTSAGYYMKGWMVVNGEDGKPDYKKSWEEYWKKIVGWIAADQNSYVYNPGKTYSEFLYNGNDAEIRPQNNANYRYGYAIQNSEDLAKVTGAVPYFAGGADPATEPNAAHALNYERAQYEAWVVYQQMDLDIGESFTTVLGDTVEGLGFNCYSIAHGVSSNPGEEDRWLSSNQIGYNFMHMLGGENTVNYRDADTSFFKSIENKILYTCAPGSYVEDFIGYDAVEGNFEFIQDPAGISLKFGGKLYATAQVETKEGATASYAFTAPEAEEATFWLDYYYGNGTTTERFIWTFGENVSLENEVALTYKLQLTEKSEEAGVHYVNTNISATLYPVDSNGKEGDPQLFPVPSVSYEVVPYDVDIVLALGAGIAQYDADSTKGTNTYDSIVTIVEPLVKAGINVKLGLVAVEHYDDVAMPLTELTKDNYLDVIQGGLAAIQAMPAGPTNLHGNIVAAKEMLDADTSVPAANKFFHVIATGRTYNFDNAEGVPTTIINKIALSGNTYYYWGHYLWQSQRGGHTSLYMIPARYNNDFNAYWADVCNWVEADGDTYAYSFTDAYNTADPQWFNTFFAANSTDAKALKLASSRFGWILGDLTNSGLAGIGSGSNPQNALNYERAQYEAWVAYNEMKDAGYNCYALCSESTSYQNGSPYIKIVKYTGTSTLQLGHSFMNFLAGESQGYVAPLLFVMTDPNTGASEMAKNFFAPVDVEKLVKSESESESAEPELRLPMFSTAPAVDPSELKILVQPTDASASIGEKVSTSVVAQGEGLKYQWYFCNAGTDVFYASSIKTATYSVEMTAARANRELYCVITDANGNVAITDTVKLIPVVSTELKILTQPVDAGASFGKTATVSVKAQGEGLKYQWYIKNAGSSTFSASSTKTAEYSVEMTNARANRELYCVITDAFGNSVTTDTVKLLPVAATELKILTQPVDGSAVLNKVVSVSVVAQGEGLKYQWYIKNAGSSTFTASSTKVATYATTLTKERVDRELYCVITDAYGNVAVTDTVKLIRVPSAELKILTQPVDGSAALNKVVTVTVKAQGEGLKYQWYIKNAGSSTFSASSTKVATYATTLTKARVDRELYCVITDAFGNTVTTDTVVLKRAD